MDDFLGQPSRRLVQRIRKEVQDAAEWMFNEPPPMEGSRRSQAGNSLRRAIADLDLLLGPEEDDVPQVRSTTRRRRPRGEPD